MRTMLLGAILCAGTASAAEPGWWMREPIRWVQTNLRETDAALDPRTFVDQVAAFDANVLLIATGRDLGVLPQQGPVPPREPLHPEGARHVRRGAEGSTRAGASASSAGSTSARPTRTPTTPTRSGSSRRPAASRRSTTGCIRPASTAAGIAEKAIEILAEALERYDVDGLFFNMFSNPASDYSGNPLGICQCDNCQRLFRARFHRDLPPSPDRDYQEFLRDATRTMSETIRDLIKAQAPEGGAGGDLARDHRHGVLRIQHRGAAARCRCGRTPPATT